MKISDRDIINVIHTISTEDGREKDLAILLNWLKKTKRLDILTKRNEPYASIYEISCFENQYKENARNIILNFCTKNNLKIPETYFNRCAIFGVPKNLKDSKELYNSLFKKTSREYKQIVRFERLSKDISINNKGFKQVHRFKNRLKKKILLNQFFLVNKALNPEKNIFIGY